MSLPPVMVLAAGLGTRMRPLTDTLPKPLVPVAGRTMLDRVLDTFAAAGVAQAVVNTHHLAAQVEARCAARTGPPAIALSPEVGERLETGGGIARALPHLGPRFFTTNADAFWVGDPGALARLDAAFDPASMDMLLLLAPRGRCVGLDDPRGDFDRMPDGRLVRRDRTSDNRVPWIYTGTAIMTPAPFAGCPDGPFSLNLLFDRALAAGRLFGLPLEGLWLTVGTLPALAEAEAALAEAGHA